MNKQIYFGVELFSLFIFLPISLFILNISLNKLVIPILLVLSIICLILLLKDKSFNRRILYELTSYDLLRKIFIRWLIGGLLLFLGFYILKPELLFYLPKTNFKIWLMVMILYPLLSVYPQELIFRAFFFNRYKQIFNSKLNLILMSGITFGLAHLFFQNWVAPVMSTIGGIMFAHTYSKSKLLLHSVIEHSLWGDLIFTVGLGYYFYSGAKL